MQIIKNSIPLDKQAELENAKATTYNAQEEVETQKLLIRYVAEMSDIYIPDEESEDDVNVSNFEEIKE